MISLLNSPGKRAFLRFVLLALILTHCIGLPSLGMEVDTIKKEAGNMPGLRQALEQKTATYEAERINHIFAGMDALLDKAVIKVERDKDKTQGRTSSLLQYLIGPQDINEIVSRFKEHPKKSLSELDQAIFAETKVQSFLDAVRHLSKKELLDEDEAQELLVKNSPLKAKHIIRLIENGAVESSDGHLIKLRTGSVYGDVLKFNDDVMSALRDAQEKSKTEFPDVSLMELLDGPYRRTVLDAFDRAGLRGDDIISDAHVLHQMRKYMLFLSAGGRISWLKAQLTRNGVSINPVNASGMAFSSGISAVLIANAFNTSDESSISQSFSVNPFGLSYCGSWTSPNHNTDWWLFYQDGYLGFGGDYSITFDQGSMWSNGNASFLAVGLYGGGWKDNLSVGLSLSTLLSSTIGVGASASINISRSHDVAYLGQRPLDDKIVAIRGLHKIEIDDKKGIGLGGGLAVNFSGAGVPLAAAFRASAQFTKKRIYRTHTDLGLAQEMLDEGKLPGLLYLASHKIQKTRIPGFEHPENLIDGDELIERKIGKLSGAFIIGIQTAVPLYAARIGASMEMSAEFELGLRRLPGEKFEVSIEPRSIHEMSFFASLLDIMGTGQVKALGLARKQIFIFDFKKAEAKKAYYDLINLGRLPSSEEIEIKTEEHAEYLLAQFRAQNAEMRYRGVQRTYLEKIRIVTAKVYAGLNAPIIPTVLKLINKAHNKAKNTGKRLDLQFEGIDREFMHSHAKSVATNGIIAVRRNTVGWQKSKGQGHSGRFNEELFITHRTLHTIDELPSGLTENKWQFDSLLIHAQLQDTIITGDEENKMVTYINSLFSTYIGSFEQKNTKAPRLISLEREFTRKDLALLVSAEAKDRIGVASMTTGISQFILYSFLKDLKNKHVDQQADMVKRFAQSSKDLIGFAALHQLLGARPEDLHVLTESSYGQIVEDAESFIATYSNANIIDGPRADFSTSTSMANRKKIRKFYRRARWHLNAIDTQLRLLYDDQYLIDDKSLLNKIYGPEKVKALIKLGARQDKTALKTSLISVRKAIYELMDLTKQGMTAHDRLSIYHMAKKKRLRFIERGEMLIDEMTAPPSNWDFFAKKKDYRVIWDLIAKLDERIKKLQNDEVMIAMDKEHVDNQIRAFQELSDELMKIVNI